MTCLILLHLPGQFPPSSQVLFKKVCRGICSLSSSIPTVTHFQLSFYTVKGENRLKWYFLKAFLVWVPSITCFPKETPLTRPRGRDGWVLYKLRLACAGKLSSGVAEGLVLPNQLCWFLCRPIPNTDSCTEVGASAMILLWQQQWDRAERFSWLPVSGFQATKPVYLAFTDSTWQLLTATKNTNP